MYTSFPKSILITLTFLAALMSPFNLISKVTAAGDVVILSHTSYLDSYGNYHVVGEVQNVGNQAVNFVQVTANFYDSNGAFIDSRFDLTLLYVILEGRKSPFEIALLDIARSARVASYSLNVSYLETSELPMKLEILWHLNYTDSKGNMHIIGDLKNLGDKTLINAKVVATYYDVSSLVVATSLFGFDPELTGEIKANQTARFEIELQKDRAQYVQTYTLAAESNQYTMIPEFPHHIGQILVATLLIFILLMTKKHTSQTRFTCRTCDDRALSRQLSYNPRQTKSLLQSNLIIGHAL